VRAVLLFLGGVALAVLGATVWVGVQQVVSSSPSARLAAVQEVPPQGLVSAEVRTPVDRTRARREGAASGLVQPAEEWVRSSAERTGIPVAAVRAYGRAALNAPESCSLGWTTLAGVGWVESHHGTIGDRSLGDDGVPSDPIVGPALDGAGPVARIEATALGTQLHGDDRWERAVGPMQFLPQTWAELGTDGDGDGADDPHDLDDAALAAAALLCRAGGDLGGVEGWSRAVLGYNRSEQYVRDVNAAALHYAQM
jgi:membrane-bound lytic murein transglycosylase B